MKKFSTQQILKFTRAEQIFQINVALIYVIFLLAKHGVIGNFFPIRKAKNSEILEEFISNLEWFQVIQKEIIKT